MCTGIQQFACVYKDLTTYITSMAKFTLLSLGHAYDQLSAHYLTSACISSLHNTPSGREIYPWYNNLAGMLNNETKMSIFCAASV